MYCIFLYLAYKKEYSLNLFKIMTPNTKKQISDLKIDPNLPVMIFDADEVLVHFAEPFAIYLKKHAHRLHLTGYRLDNAIKKAKTDEVATPDTAKDLVWGFICLLYTSDAADE